MKFQPVILVVMLVALLSACVAPIAVSPGEQAIDQPVEVAADIQSSQTAGDHDHDHGRIALNELGQELGEVNFPVSCTAEAQAEFNHAMALLHSFWFDPAIEAFNTVLELDATCAMAHWGIAISMLGNPYGWTLHTSQALEGGWAAIERARAIGAQTPREEAYIEALAAFYQDADTVDAHTRLLAYEQAMAQLVHDYPEDPEAALYYAMALNITAVPGDKSYANQFKAAELLEGVFQEQPDHPGVAHYLIHTFDFPDLAQYGLDAALRYAEIAPAAPHALHMPSHIFTRLGYWQESIESNVASAQAAIDELAATHVQGVGSYNALHAMDYLMYAYLQLGQDGHAQALLDEINAIEQLDAANLGAAYAFGAMPARYALERNEWAEAAALELHPPTMAWERFPQAEALLVFARGLGAARSGDLATAQAALARLEELREAMLAANQAYWAEQAEIQSTEVAAWIALAEDRRDEALDLMRAAVAMEAATEKHPITPGPLIPAHELLGEMLILLDRPAEALAEFEASHAIEPNRFRGLYGAARAAELAGEMEIARGYYEALLALAADADTERAELIAARAFVGQ